MHRYFILFCFVLLYFICMNVLYVCISLFNVCDQCLWKLEESMELELPRIVSHYVCSGN